MAIVCSTTARYRARSHLSPPSGAKARTSVRLATCEEVPSPCYTLYQTLRGWGVSESRGSGWL